MRIDDLLEIIKTRRSIRKYKPDPIPEDYLNQMIEAARWAPSGANAQPWEFIVVKDAQTKLKMAELHSRIRPEQYYMEQTRSSDLRHAGLATFPNTLPGIKDAPVLIVVCGDRRVHQASVISASFMCAEGSADAVFMKNIANATYSLLLAATALGLGTQWFTVTAEYGELLKPLLGVPPFIQIQTIIPVGYPAYQPAAPYRRSRDTMVHQEKYDMSKYRTGEQIIEYIRTLRKPSAEAYEAGGMPKA